MTGKGTKHMNDSAQKCNHLKKFLSGIVIMAAAGLIGFSALETQTSDARAIIHVEGYPGPDQCNICVLMGDGSDAKCEITDDEGFEQCVAFGAKCSQIWPCNRPSFGDSGGIVAQ